MAREVEITLGYHVPTGEQMTSKLSHMIYTGQTQEAGKTTAMEAYATQTIEEDPDKKFLIFLTKQGEEAFMDGRLINPYFKDEVDWKYVKELVEAVTGSKQDFKESWIIDAVQTGKYDFLDEADTLEDVHENIQTLLSRHRDDEDTQVRLSGMSEGVYTSLNAYLDDIVPIVREANLSTELDLEPGINIMDLRHFDSEMQSLIIADTVEKVYKEEHDTIIGIPEGWKFLPKGGNPCKRPVESFIRQGATNGNFLWIDAQDMAGVDTSPIKQVSDWLLGVQMEKNEVERTRDQMPVPKTKAPGKEEVMTLGVGHFFYGNKNRGVEEIYVMPAWMPEIEWKGKSGEDLAEAIARKDMPEYKAEDVKHALESGEIELDREIVDETGVEDTAEANPAPDTDSTDDVDYKKKYEQVQQQLQQLQERKKALADELDTREERIEQLEDKVAELESEENNIKKKIMEETNGGIDQEELLNSVSTIVPSREEIVGIVEDKIEERTATLVTQQQLSEALADVETGTGTARDIDSVQDAVLQDFQENAVDSIMQDVASFTNNQKKLVLYLEAKGSRVDSQKAWVENALGWKGYGSDLRKEMKALMDDGFVRKDSSKLYPNVRDMIEDQLSGYDVDEEVIDQTHEQVLARIKEDTEL